MTASSLEIPRMYVEGQADCHALLHLLGRHGIPLDKSVGPVIIQDAKNDDGVLDAMRTAARASTRLPVGFVIDADESTNSRWQAVCDRLRTVGLELPNTIPEEGFIGESSETLSRIGVWIMPNNKLDSARLEDLIATLVPVNDPLYSHACTSTKASAQHGCRVKPQDVRKSEIHCWLAWQEEPGLSIGTAIKAKYFNHNSNLANLFVAWFRTLYGL